MTPLKVSLAALLNVNVLLPRLTWPAPLRLTILAPLVVCEISNVLASLTLEFATLPLPESASVPLVIVVAPL